MEPKYQFKFGEQRAAEQCINVCVLPSRETQGGRVLDENLISATALVMMLTGSVFAQTQPTAPAGDPAAADKLMSIEDPVAVKPFFTDDTMATMWSDDEMKAAWTAMSKENQAAVRNSAKPRLLKS